jgi:thiamine biosynthesis protein ThiI
MTTRLQHLFVASYSGEMSVKARGTRRRFTDRLAGNLAEALDEAGIEHHLEPAWSRLFVRASSPKAGEIARRVFGIHAVSTAVERPWKEKADLLRDGEEVFAPAVAGKTFAVRVRRGGRSHQIPFKSPEVERELGARLAPHAAGVDLTNPEVEVRIELHGDRALYSSHRELGCGGFPLGCEGRALAMVSGGFDSVVAAWLMLRRGVTVDYLFCNLGGDAHRDAVMEVLKVLADGWSYGYRPRLHMVDFRPAVAEIQERCPEGLWQVVLKRQMLRAADAVARWSRTLAVVTGEAVGQVSSQTLQNLAVISQATDRMILRPLVAHHKEEITELARSIGSYDLSAKVPEYCALAPDRPETQAKLRRVIDAEADLDPELITGLAEARAVFDLRALDLSKLRAPELEVAEVPGDATVVDLRSKAAYESWHYPGAVRLGYREALEARDAFDRDHCYLFYCEVGLKSAHVAEVLHRAGYRAHHLAGGFRKLVRQLEEEDPALKALLSPALL